MPHTFRWIDHVQHLPGLLEQVQSHGLFVPFPDENAQPPSKSQLKKLAKQKGGDKPEQKGKPAEAAPPKAHVAPDGGQKKPEEVKQAPA